MLIVYALVVLFIFRAISRSLLNRLTDADSYIRKAKTLISYFGAKKSAARVLQRGLELPDNTKEDEDELNFQIGNVYYLMKKYPEAVAYYEKMEERLKTKGFPFDKGYLHMIMSYYNAGKVEKARAIYHILMNKRFEDPRFGTVESLLSRIFK